MTLKNNGGLPSQVDKKAFTVGQNLALSPRHGGLSQPRA